MSGIAVTISMVFVSHFLKCMCPISIPARLEGENDSVLSRGTKTGGTSPLFVGLALRHLPRIYRDFNCMEEKTLPRTEET